MSLRILPQTLHHLKQGKLLLTASKRQADYLHQAFREQQQSKVWLRANIMTWQNWVQDSLERLQMMHAHTAATVLSKNQCLYVLQQIMKDTENPLLNIPLASKKVYRAAEILNTWGAVDEVHSNDEFTTRLETRQFRDWYLALSEFLLERNLIAPYELEQQLVELLNSHGNHALPESEQILLVGFQQFTPVQEVILELLQSNDCEISEEHRDKDLATEQRLEFSDVISELQHTALWAKSHYDENKDQRIAVIVPELEQYREQIRRYFSKLFQADYWLDATHTPSKPFDISLALPLPDYPLINDLLLLLQVISGKIKNHELIYVLQSRYLGDKPNLTALAPLIQQIKSSRFTELTLAQIDRYVVLKLNEKQRETLQDTISLFKHCQSFGCDSTMAPSDWVVHLNEWLIKIGYAKESILASEEYQTKEALYKVLESIASFDVIIPSISWLDWLQLLRQQLHQRLFQPQTGHCPVQIMGIFEAQSIPFDRIRMIGVDNQLWPAKPNPNPFLPYNLQKSLDMPSANAERELALSTDLYQSLLQHCDEIVFSHINDSGESNTAVSPIIEHVPLVSRTHHGSVNHIHDSLFQLSDKIQLEKIDDDYGQPITADYIKGGSYMLKAMSACPFQAFAHYRLGAKDPYEPQTDLDAMDKGSLVHKILELVWRDLLDGSSEDLITKLSTDDFQMALTDTIQQLLARHNEEKNNRYSVRKIRLEAQRLKRLINEWLTMECKREPFRVIAGEQRQQYQLNNMSITLTIDRIDQLEDGSYNIIDYKTGNPQAKDWFGDRPTEPQMPLYGCILYDDNKPINAIAYGQVQYQKCTFKGISEEAKSLPGITTAFAKHKFPSDAKTINDQVIEWKETLNNLITDYSTGMATVDPKENNTCEYCDLKGLCRVDEINDRPELEAAE